MKGIADKDKKGSMTARTTERHGFSDSGSGGFRSARGKENDGKKLKRDKSKYLRGVTQGDLRLDVVEVIKRDIHVLDYVDYSSKYGVGYLLSNNTFGVFFNDSTKIIYDPVVVQNKYSSRQLIYNSEHGYDNADAVLQGTIEYINKKSSGTTDRNEKYSVKDYPPQLKKKVTLLQHFKGYLENNINKKKHLFQQFNEGDMSERSIVVKKWMRTKHAIIFRLSNKVVQVIFFDQTEIILHSENRAVTYVNKKGDRLYYSLESSIESDNAEMTKRLNYTRQVLTHMLQAKFGSSKYQDINSKAVREQHRHEIEAE